MSTSTNNEKDEKLLGLIKTIFERVPKEKRLTADVLMQLLNTKYSSVFSAEYLAERAGLLSDLIDSHYNQQEDKVKKNSSNQGVDKSDDDGNDDDDEEEEEDEEGEDEDYDDDDNDESEEEDTEFASEETDGSGDDSGAEASARATKRAREEDGNSGVARRCLEMVDCLRRTGYRVRKQDETESAEVYLQEYLKPFFYEKGLDPERYSKADAKRYSAMKELQQLQEDGADITLDRGARAGRGLNHLMVKRDVTIKVKTSKFLDDE